MTRIQDTVGFRLTQVTRMRRNLVASVLEPAGLYVGQDLIMVQLWHEEGLTQSRLAEGAGVDVSTMTKTLQRLERQGFVYRRQDSEDMRVWRVFLTERGRALESMVTEGWLKAEQQTFQGFTSSDRALFAAFLQRIEQNLS
jgi:MarR family transcriptional regulator, organic hydroperoxide resistance regulator